MAMFQSLSDRIQGVFKRLRGKGALTENDVNEAMREVRMALLEADVNFRVVKDLVTRIRERAVGTEVLQSLTPGQQVIKIVNEELIALMGGAESKIAIASRTPTLIMLVGLQGAGKTTHAAKLAYYFKKQGKHPLLVACDIYRPAAVQQLRVLGEQVGVPVFAQEGAKPAAIATAALREAELNGQDMVIVDTAGRLHINEELMAELDEIKVGINPHEIIIVLDAMIGQDSVNVAEQFHQKLGLTGVILSKLDGDTRGGAALSVRAVTGCPVKFAGVGEKIDALEVFYPERMASRILGMGDVLTLIEKAEQAVDAEKARQLEEKIRSQELDLEDFLDQIGAIRKMGSFSSLLEMIPGMGNQLKDVTIDENQFNQAEAIIRSMTPQERQTPSVIRDSRKKRIAAGSGTSVQDVGRLLKQYEQTKKMMAQMSGMAGFKANRLKSGKGKKGKKGKSGKPGNRNAFKMPFPFS